VIKAIVYGTITVLLVTLPVWIGPAFTIYKLKQLKRRKKMRRTALLNAQLPAA